MTRIWRIAVMLCMALCGGASADDALIDRCADLAAYKWEPGFANGGIPWDKIDVPAALPVCEAAAKLHPGHVATQYRLGRIFLQQRNFDRALPILLQAAEEGYAPAQTAYGTVFMGGDVSPDYEQALYWLGLADANGNLVASTNLGIMYYFGDGTEQDVPKAVALIGKAAEGGVDVAQFALGQLLASGISGEPDLLAAEGWFRQAAAQGHAPAQRTLAILLDRTGIDHNEALSLLELAAEQGDGPAATYRGWMFLNGRSGPVNVELALSSLQLGYDLGDAHAAYLLGAVYEEGTVIEEDSTKAISYYLQAAWRGSPEGQYSVGRSLRDGHLHFAEAEPTALAWFLLAAQQGHTDAQIALAQMYSYSFEGKRTAWYDTDQALYWYETAASLGRLDAGVEAAFYLAGKGDYAAARAHIERALASGDEHLVEIAHEAIEQINFAKRGERLPL